MSGTVVAVANRVPGCCHAMRCKRDKCRISLEGAPKTRLLVDMDCDALNIPNQQKRCDYLFIGEEGNTTWIAPIELKSGGLKATEVLEQLEGGVREVESWLPRGVSTRSFGPVGPGAGAWENDPSVRTKKASLQGNTTARAKETDRPNQMRRRVEGKTPHQRFWGLTLPATNGYTKFFVLFSTLHFGIGPTSSSGSMRRPKRLMRQSRCGPVTRPVAPTSAMGCPWATR